MVVEQQTWQPLSLSNTRIASDCLCPITPRTNFTLEYVNLSIKRVKRHDTAFLTAGESCEMEVSRGERGHMATIFICLLCAGHMEV